ncbi:MAG TPA: LacI family DNA-binding transcriptional regulator [Candidatus Angelobacter sp.]|nr:LacI family DNA-binding transcriptional regulator [Candidatus Angelobacter sp.]
MATIVDVARRAGVSVSTVSHVVNRTRTVSPGTARLVEQAIAATGYAPNSIAQSLARSATNSVGIAISAISNPYFSDIICAIETECSRLGLMVFLSDTQEDPAQELRVVQAFHQRRVDGIILAPSADPEQKAINYLERIGVPCVLVDRLPPSRFDRVGVQNKWAMELLVSHLIGHGHKRIGLIAGQPGFATTLERIDGYRAALRTHGLPWDDDLLQAGNPTVASAAEATRKLLALADPPTALATGNNLATIGAMRAIREAGLRVPADLALAGFDDFEWADCFEPRLTVIAQPCQEIGRRAAALLVDRIKGQDERKRTIRLQPSLVIRNSCGCP